METSLKMLLQKHKINQNFGLRRPALTCKGVQV
jgi:hypothetical protein